MSWWGVGYTIVTTAAPLIAVIQGADLLTAGIVLAISKIVFYTPLFYDQYKLLKKEKIWLYGKTSLELGFKNLTHSTALSAKDLLESLRQQGVRVVLGPLSGAKGVAAFATMRTGANVVIQGLRTITGPMMPELMRFLNQKDQERTEVAFGTVWFVIMLFSPAVVLCRLLLNRFTCCGPEAAWILTRFFLLCFLSVCLCMGWHSRRLPWREGIIY